MLFSKMEKKNGRRWREGEGRRRSPSLPLKPKPTNQNSGEMGEDDGQVV
jgi:hypothetical protein